VSESVCPNHLNEQQGMGAAAPCPFNECFHGTHVAGVAAGDGRGAGQSFSGVARGATVLAVQAFSRVTDSNVCAGSAPCVAAFSSDILAALEHLYILSWDYRIAAINLSLGSNLPSAACDDEPYKAIVDNLRAVGIATVVASGNAGATSGLASPACVSSAVSVVDHQGGSALGFLQHRAVVVAARAWRVDRVVDAPRWVRRAEWHVDGRRSCQWCVRCHASGIAQC
jgi:hypothetical protein